MCCTLEYTPRHLASSKLKLLSALGWPLFPANIRDCFEIFRQFLNQLFNDLLTRERNNPLTNFLLHFCHSLQRSPMSINQFSNVYIIIVFLFQTLIDFWSFILENNILKLLLIKYKACSNVRIKYVTRNVLILGREPLLHRSTNSEWWKMEFQVFAQLHREVHQSGAFLPNIELSNAIHIYCNFCPREKVVFPRINIWLAGSVGNDYRCPTARK